MILKYLLFVVITICLFACESDDETTEETPASIDVEVPTIGSTTTSKKYTATFSLEPSSIDAPYAYEIEGKKDLHMIFLKGEADKKAKISVKYSNSSEFNDDYWFVGCAPADCGSYPLNIKVGSNSAATLTALDRTLKKQQIEIVVDNSSPSDEEVLVEIRNTRGEFTSGKYLESVVGAPPEAVIHAYFYDMKTIDVDFYYSGLWSIDEYGNPVNETAVVPGDLPWNNFVNKINNKLAPYLIKFKFDQIDYDALPIDDLNGYVDFKTNFASDEMIRLLNYAADNGVNKPTVYYVKSSAVYTRIIAQDASFPNEITVDEVQLFEVGEKVRIEQSDGANAADDWEFEITYVDDYNNKVSLNNDPSYSIDGSFLMSSPFELAGAAYEDYHSIMIAEKANKFNNAFNERPEDEFLENLATSVIHEVFHTFDFRLPDLMNSTDDDNIMYYITKPDKSKLNKSQWTSIH
ncbi:MAG: hypothetical protein OCD76_10820 [Reichenbachiella sp.]